MSKKFLYSGAFDSMAQYNRFSFFGATMKSTAFALLLLPLMASAADCLDYGEQVTLAGTLSRDTFPEQPASVSAAPATQPASYFFVSVTRAFCVSAKEPEPAEIDVGKVQLVFPAGKDAYAPLRPYIGSKVECDGELFHATSADQHTAILLSDARCKPSY